MRPKAWFLHLWSWLLLVRVRCKSALFKCSFCLLIESNEMESSSFLICPHSDTFRGLSPPQLWHITATLKPPPSSSHPPAQTWTPSAPLGPFFVAYLIHYTMAFVCLGCNDGQDEYQMKCAVVSVWVTCWQNEGIYRGFAGCFQIINEE